MISGKCGRILRLLDSGYMCTCLSSGFTEFHIFLHEDGSKTSFLVPRASGSHVSVSASRGVQENLIRQLRGSSLRVNFWTELCVSRGD